MLSPPPDIMVGGSVFQLNKIHFLAIVMKNMLNWLGGSFTGEIVTTQNSAVRGLGNITVPHILYKRMYEKYERYTLSIKAPISLQPVTPAIAVLNSSSHLPFTCSSEGEAAL